MATAVDLLFLEVFHDPPVLGRILDLLHLAITSERVPDILDPDRAVMIAVEGTPDLVVAHMIDLVSDTVEDIVVPDRRIIHEEVEEEVTTAVVAAAAADIPSPKRTILSPRNASGSLA